MRHLFITLLFCSAINFCFSQKINITITGIRSTKGSIQLQFYNNSDDFDNRKASLTKTVSKSGMKNGTLTVSYSDLAKGHYGIALLDDENNSKDMDYGMVLPKEGFGFSNYYHKSMSQPKFDQFDFYLQDEPKSVKIQIRYM